MKHLQAPTQESQNHWLIQAGRHPWGHLTGFLLTGGLTSKLGEVAQGLDQLNFENVQEWNSTASLPTPVQCHFQEDIFFSYIQLEFAVLQTENIFFYIFLLNVWEESGSVPSATSPSVEDGNRLS